MELTEFMLLLAINFIAIHSATPHKYNIEKFNRKAFLGKWFTIFVSPKAIPAECLRADVSKTTNSEVEQRQREVGHLLPPCNWSRTAFKMRVNSTASGSVLMLQETDKPGVMAVIPSAEMLGGQRYHGRKPLARFYQYGPYLVLRDSVFNGTTLLAAEVKTASEALEAAGGLGVAVSGHLTCSRNHN